MVRSRASWAKTSTNPPLNWIAREPSAKSWPVRRRMPSPAGRIAYAKSCRTYLKQSSSPSKYPLLPYDKSVALALIFHLSANWDVRFSRSPCYILTSQRAGPICDQQRFRASRDAEYRALPQTQLALLINPVFRIADVSDTKIRFSAISCRSPNFKIRFF